jgi:Fe-S-cluster-containing hydrogenase component 2
MACVRVCPVEAVTAQEGTLEIVEESCIECGLCVPACQHDAIEATGDLATARKHLDGRAAVLILATESVVHFHPASPEQVLNACYAAGFRAPPRRSWWST